MKKLFLVFSILTASITVMGQQPIPVKPRILISTDIGGTDPDDNQSMAHFLMYSEIPSYLFEIFHFSFGR